MAEEDAVVDLSQQRSDDSEEEEEIDEEIDDINQQFKLVVNMTPIPKPMPQHGTGRGGSGGRIRTFMPNSYTATKNHLQGHIRNHVQNTGFNIIPRDIPVSVGIWFFIKRPYDHFIGKCRETGNLKPESLEPENTVQTVKPDIDNLAKFVLDGLKEVAFEDDAQVVELMLHKVRDSDGECNGKIAIEVSRYNPNIWMSQFAEF